MVTELESQEGPWRTASCPVSPGGCFELQSRQTKLRGHLGGTEKRKRKEEQSRDRHAQVEEQLGTVYCPQNSLTGDNQWGIANLEFRNSSSPKESQNEMPSSPRKPDGQVLWSG